MSDEQPRKREWKPGDTIGPQDFGVTPAAPNPLGDAMKRDLARRAEEMQDEGDGPVSSEEQST